MGSVVDYSTILKYSANENYVHKDPTLSRTSLSGNHRPTISPTYRTVISRYLTIRTTAIKRHLTYSTSFILCIPCPMTSQLCFFQLDEDHSFFSVVCSTKRNFGVGWIGIEETMMRQDGNLSTSLYEKQRNSFCNYCGGLLLASNDGKVGNCRVCKRISGTIAVFCFVDSHRRLVDIRKLCKRW